MSHRTQDLPPLTGLAHLIRELRYQEPMRQGFAVILVIVYTATAVPIPALAAIGLGIGLLGELVRLYASGFIVKNKELATDGAYRFVRHPLYTGNILLVTGELDMNVDPASTLQVVNALIKARKDFDLLIVPNDGHGALRTTGDVSYGLRRQYDFFIRHLQGEVTPDWNALPQTAVRQP